MSSVNSVLKSLSFTPSEEEMNETRKKVNIFATKLRKGFSKSNIFLGGSFAKGTITTKKVIDVDIFARLDKKKFNLAKLEKAVRKTSSSLGYNVSLVHGSRDYFRVQVDKKTVFEVVPALKISKPKEAENVIDLSYFHVSYVKKQIARNRNLAREIQLAKTFLAAQGVYGAESYIRGFSGYAVECLIIQYKSLLNLLRTLSKAEKKIILDPAKHYKKNSEIIYRLNESKIMGPIILVDPTWKERNVTAAVSQEAFDKLKSAAIRFLKAPSASFFEEKVFSADKFKEKVRKGEEYACISLETDKQDGDIAGTKLKKYSNYLLLQLEKQFEVKNSHFEYEGKREAKLHLILVSKMEIIRKGPPIKMEKSVAAFRKEHKSTYVKAGFIYAKIKFDLSFNQMLSNFIISQEDVAKQMSIVKMSAII